ncbi:MAG TPA: S9 family peptidase, partial [Bacteroidetes bacterium]|nr:S9 family peptidase [Bacteroidota bacterium]
AYQISPDGKYFSFLASYERRKNIFIQEIGSDKAKRITSETERDINGYFWANNNRLVFVKDSGGDENYQLLAVDKTGENPKNLTPFDGVRIEIIDDLEDIEDYLIIGMNKNNPMLFEPYRININTGDFVQLAKNENPLEPISSWMTDHDGKLRIAVKMVGGTNTTLMYRENEDEDFKDVITTDFKEQVSPLFFDFKEKGIVYSSSNLNRDKAAIVRFDMNTGKETGEILFEHPEVDVNSLGYSRKRKVLTSISYITDKKHYKFLDNETEDIYNHLRSKLGGYEIAFADHTKDENMFIIRTYSDKSLGAYYLYNKNNNELEKIADVSPWLDENDMAEQKPVKYISRDGLTINGYLTLPVGVKPENLPVVINPHGGPWHRDVWGYNQEVQLLANRGFAVLQMNFRGSTGYGRRFWELSFKQWGKKMQDDISDGVNWLIGQGIADPERVAIYGASYGGYATLAGVTFTPDIYKAAVDYVGVSNLFTFLQTIPPYWKPYLDMMYEMVGHPEKDKKYLEEASPVFHVDKIKTPLYVVQGANDPRVNIDESDQIVRTLRNKGVDVPYLVKYDEGHGFRNEENRFVFYKSMLGFLMKYLRI